MSVTSQPSAAPQVRARARRLLERWWFPLTAFAVWRVSHLVLVAALGGLSAPRTAPYAMQPESHPGFFLWDAAWYLHVLEHGYEVIPGWSHQPTAFFPLLPWLTWPLRMVTGSALVAALVVTTVAAVAAIITVYAVAREWRGERVARWTVVLLLAFPTSAFLWQYYTEALFTALSAGAVLAHRRGQLPAMAALAAAAAMSRPPGVLVAAVLAVDAVRRHGIRRDLGWYVLGVAGVVPVLLVQWVQAGDPFAWLGASEAWGRYLAWPWQTLSTSLSPYLRGPRPEIGGWSGAATGGAGSPLDIAAMVVFVWLAVVAVRRRWPLPAVGLIIAFTVVPLASGILTSGGRYVLAAWPGFAVLAGLAHASSARWAWTGVFAGASVLLLHDLSSGLFVG